MSKLVWDQTGERRYETGVKNGVLYVQNSRGAYGDGVAWNGLTAVTESPSGAEATALYADDTKYLNLYSTRSSVPLSRPTPIRRSGRFATALLTSLPA